MAKKYIDAEKLIAELRRQKRELELSIQSQGDYGQSCHIVAYDNIISLIDSLQQEQQEVDLEEEADRLFFSLGWYEGDHDQPMLDCISLEEFRGIARHFYELGRLNARKED